VLNGLETLLNLFSVQQNPPFGGFFFDLKKVVDGFDISLEECLSFEEMIRWLSSETSK
jgi:hypothetical protein